MKRSPRTRLRKQDEKDKDGFVGKRIVRDMMEKQWKMELMNSREDLILKRQLELLTKQQRVVQRGLDKDMQVLHKLLEKQQSRQSVTLQSPSSTSLRSARSLSNIPSTTNRSGMSRRTSHVHVAGLPPLKPKSFSHLPDTGIHAISLPTMLHEAADADVRNTELPVEKEYHRSQTPPPRRKTAYQPVGISTVEAVVSPAANRHTFKTAKSKSSSALCQRQDILPPISVHN